MMKFKQLGEQYIRIGISAVIALIFLSITFFVSGLPIVFNSEKFYLQCYEIVKDGLGLNKFSTSHEDSVIFVNTHYADTLAIEYEAEQEVGPIPVVNRKMLYQFLKSIQDQGYKYILLDVIFDKADRLSEDKELYELIATMDRIVIPSVPECKMLADTILVNKIGEVIYNGTFWESDFVKYRFKHNGKRSLALKMYEEITHDTTSIDECFARHCAMLTFDDYHANIKTMTWDDNHLNDWTSIKDDVGGKYIIIGDFGDVDYFDGDTHNTFLGEVPGPVINFCAYKYLQKGHHRISGMLLFILFLVFWWLVFQTLKQSNFTWIYILGYPVFWIIMFFIIYLLYDEVYDVLTTSLMFYILKTTIEIHRGRKLIMERITTKIISAKTTIQTLLKK